MADLITERLEDFGLSVSAKPKAAFSSVGIVGCGQTGQRIALMIATMGIEVIFLEISKEKIEAGLKEIAEELDSRISHWGMTAGEKKATLTRIKGTLDYADFKNCDIVIEAILSRNREYSLPTRKDVFKLIEAHTRPDCIIATNSTTTVITILSSELKYKDRCISMHISTTNPDANVMEIVKGHYTGDWVLDKVRVFAKMINKVPVPVSESAGLVSARIFVPLMNEACDVLMEGVASMESIDFVMRSSLGLPLGPFEMADKIGLDRVLRYCENLYNEFGDRKYIARPILKRLVRANQFGRKTGHGFYTYDELGNKVLSANPSSLTSEL